MNQENGKEKNPKDNAMDDDFPITPQTPKRQELKTSASDQQTDQSNNQEKVSMWPRIKNWFRRKSDQATLTDWLMAFFTFVLAATTIIFTVYAKRQWREMHDASAQTDRIITADERLARAMEDSVKEAGNSLQATIDQTHLDQRAWVGAVSIIQPEARPDGWVRFGVVVTNSGKTPAKNFTSKLGWETIMAGEKFVPSYEPSGTIQSVAVIQPGISITLYTVPLRPTDRQLAAIKSGMVTGYLFGELKYDDVFGKHRTTTFCSFSDKAVQMMGNCAQYNDEN